jgi:hypothetical protein
MTKPSKRERINAPENESTNITERCKKLLEKPQTKEIKEEIKRLRREYFKMYPIKKP